MKKQTEGALVKKLRGERSFRQFEEYLNEKIPSGIPGKTTFASAWNWVNDLHPVNGTCLMAWLSCYPAEDPRHMLAVDILSLRAQSIPAYSAEDRRKLMTVINRGKEVAK